MTFAELMSKVGYFLFYWSHLEKALTNAIREARSVVAKPSERVVGTFKERLSMWDELARRLPENTTRTDEVERITRQARTLRRIRNLIVHGLVAGNSMPATGSGYIECAEGGYDRPTGKTVQYSIDDLEHFAQAADACRRGFQHLDSFNYLLDSSFHETGGSERPTRPPTSDW